MVDDNNKLIGVKEASEFLNLTIGSLYQLTHKRIIRYSKPNGKKIYFDKNDLIEYQNRNKIQSIN